MLRQGFCWGLIAVGLLAMGGGGVPAQVQFDKDRSELSGMPYIPQDRQLRNLLDRARAQLHDPEGDRRLGLELVQQVLDKAEDYFSDRTLRESLRGNAEVLLMELPEEERRLYEQLYGQEARTLLQAASESDEVRINDVIRRFLYTRAGAEAAFAKAATEMDRGHFLTAARLFERLLHRRPSEPLSRDLVWERAITAYWKGGFLGQSQTVFLHELKDLASNISWRGKPVLEFATNEAAFEWLRQELGESGPSHDIAVKQWLVPGGAENRNASVRDVSPVFDNAWRMPLLMSSDSASPERLNELQILVEAVNAGAQSAEHQRTFAVAEPLVIGDTLVFSSYGRIRAVDARTGEFRWQAADADPVFEHLAHAVATPGSGTSAADQSPLEDFIAQRAWLDATSASLSSEGQRVYEVFDSGIVLGQPSYDLSGNANTPFSPASYNRLRAYDIKTEGKLLWEVGGPPGRVSLPLANTFFLGAPLPVDGSLYVLGEERGQVRLNVLDPQTGEVEWSLALLNTAEDVNENIERRFMGLSPAHVGGILLCPTGGGSMVAVDILQRSLLWAHVYDEPQQSEPFPNFPGRRPVFNDPVDGPPSTERLLATPRWYGPSTIIAGQSVLHAPPDHPELHCISLLDGQSIWSRPRERLLYQAGVYEGTVILVGDRHVEAARLESGKTAWSLPLRTPSGIGVRDGHLYRLPLRGGEIATVDLREGRLLALSETRSGSELGSLVAAGGRLFTQTATELRGFRSIDELQTQIAADLAADPRDPAALAVRAEMHLHAGQTSEALADLRASFDIVPDERVRELMADTLLEQLREDFARHREVVSELERLATDPDRRIRLVRTIADGLEAEGELEAAYGRYLELFTLDGLERLVEHPSPERTVRLDRWVQGRLQRIYELTPPEQRSGLDEQTNDFIASVIAGDNPDLLIRTVSAFGQHPLGEAAVDALAERIDPQENPLRAEAIWLRRRREGTPEQRAAAIVKLVQLYAVQGRGELVDALLQELSGTDAETILHNGQTGRESTKELRELPSVSAALADVIRWPTGSIEVRAEEHGGQRQQSTPLRMSGPVDPLLSASSFGSDDRGEVTAFDGFGRQEWTIQIPARAGFPESHYVERRGHRAVLFLGDQFRVIDMLRYGHRPRTIVEDTVVEHSGEDMLHRRVIRMSIHRMGLRTHWRSEDGVDEYLGFAGPLRDEHFCYQQGETLISVDPFSGEEFWRVDGLPKGCEILADESYVILVPPDPRDDRQVAHIFQVSDGAFVGAQRLPPEIERSRKGADWGRRFLTRTRHPGTEDVTLAMLDPVSGEILWEHRIPHFHSWAPLDGEDLVVLDETGGVRLIDTDTGEIVVKTQTEITTHIKSMAVVGHPHEWFLFTERLPQADQEVRLLPMHRRHESPAVNGLAFGFDREAHKQLWSRELLGLRIDPEMPGRWPLLVLSADAWVANDRRQRGDNRFQNLMLLNKRTGQTLFEGDGTGRWQGTAWTLSDGKPQLLLSFGRTALAVSFDDEATSDTGQEPQDGDDANAASDRETMSDTEPTAPAKRNVPAPPAALPPVGEEM